MCPPAPIEFTQVVAQNEVVTPRFERVALLILFTSFLITSSVGLALYLAKFEVDSRITKGTIYGLFVLGLLWFRLTKPTSRLTPTERSYRARRRVAALLGFLGAISLLGSIVVGTSLHTASDWVLLSVAAGMPLGVGLLINVRFTMGTGR